MSTSGKLNLKRLPYYFSSLLKLLLNSKITFRKNTIRLKKHDLNFKIKTILDLLILKEVILDEEYENSTVKIDSKDKIIVDIGAGFGDFSILAAKRYPEASVFAFEPNSSYFLLLQENIKDNRVKNVKAFRKAINSLDELFNLIRSGKIDFLKMDCEGCEFEIINTRNIKSLKQVKKMVMEYHENETEAARHLKEILERVNFTVEIKPRVEVERIGLLYALNKS